jgi:hypothetical protein
LGGCIQFCLRLAYDSYPRLRALFTASWSDLIVAAIVVITHHADVPVFTSKPEDGLVSPYMLGPIIVELARRGHRVTLAKGVPAQNVAGDLAILHVDFTIVPPDYLEFAASFPRCLNGRVGSIAKRAVADGLVQQDTDWVGAVIVKTDLNCRGAPELRANQLAELTNLPVPFPNVTVLSEYLTFASAAAVPGAYWLNDGLVVQKFLPERLDDGFGVRFWTFLGDVERCDVCVSSSAMVKAATTIRLQPSPVPKHLRALRKRLGLDYGKIDFVLHDGRPVVLDVNKTVGRPPSKKGSDWPLRYAEGVERYLSR